MDRLTWREYLVMIGIWFILDIFLQAFLLQNSPYWKKIGVGMLLWMLFRWLWSWQRRRP